MENISTVAGLLALWPTRQDIVFDVLGDDPDSDINVGKVHKWAKNNAIPAKYHQGVLTAAKLRGIDLTADLLVRLHDPRRQAA